MRILQVHTRYRLPGGEDAVVDAEARLLRATGHEVVRHEAENPQEAVPAAVALAAATWNPRSAAAITDVVASTRPDVAHVHNTWYALSASVVAALARADVPVVMTLHNYRLLCVNARLFRDGQPCEDCVGTSPASGVRHRCYHGSTAASAAAALPIAVHRRRGTWTRDVTRYIVFSEFSRRRFIAGGLPEARLVTKPNAVPEPGPRPAPPSASRSLLFVGRLEEEKGVADLLAAWSQARPEGYELIVIGDGPLSGRLQADAPPGVRFTGRLPAERVREEMLRARALLFPSRWYEGQPLTVLEAFAAGLPVLGSDLGATGELCAPTGPGWAVPAADRRAWTDAIASLRDDREVDRAGALVRRRYEADFTEAESTRRLEAVYREAVSSRRRKRTG